MKFWPRPLPVRSSRAQLQRLASYEHSDFWNKLVMIHGSMFGYHFQIHLVTKVDPESSTSRGLEHDFSNQEVCVLRESHLLSRSFSTDSSACITNHQLDFPDWLFLLTLRLIFSPCMLQNRSIAFSTVLVVACGWVPQILRAPSTFTLAHDLGSVTAPAVELWACVADSVLVSRMAGARELVLVRGPWRCPWRCCRLLGCGSWEATDA